MSEFNFNPELRNFPIYGTSQRNITGTIPIHYRLWIVELVYVYSLGREMVMDEFKEQKSFRVAYRQWVGAKDEQALQTFHEAGFFRDLQWVRVNHDMIRKQPVDGWFQYDYVLDLADGTETQYTVIG
ncbi:MAG: hypothetical protein QF560_17135 [SAR324 cluster bacterium]|jgi:hypothetical protein|uniref:Uncharacterized protein n=1 Tax=marine metagenome TaxID=408172 RepID=A0A383CUV8_9ZZZZ|nr:hypothetical protein [Deltaproteobacteria bacterium]MBU06307.1 hypothetical protein [Dehalococcoidales bacterium]MDP6092504.1 hypothetical protein [SAR324 cluster bacterium]MDP6329332.1 hypothetical protein [SAR324 cluster bacterium]MDP6464664.1 hypothetical protein [SAR324 cluster bacterium]|tara:strand:+ start:237 stop:617 length:381 start_codon:yes stop_codon:yes gene_type:complete